MRFWILIALGLAALVAAEFVFGDVLLDSTSTAMTPLARILLLAIGGLAGVVALSELARRRLVRAEAGPSAGARRAPRALSVIPLLRAVLLTILVILVVLFALGQAGVNIGPMLAGAGVVGIVLGLGAQSLLRDILAGVFYVIEDAFRIGEYIEVGDMRGTVEAISLRSMKLRHHRGALQTIPYGTIASVSNQSRDWVIVKLLFQMPLQTDVMRVKRVVKEVSARFMEDERFASLILEPLKFQGIDDVDLFGLRVRLKFMAVPGEQFVMRREMLRALQEAFRANGIEFARRSVLVGDAATGAAAAADDEDEEMSPV